MDVGEENPKAVLTLLGGHLEDRERGWGGNYALGLNAGALGSG